ncbi:MAG: sigma-70 family RNA polymerase sigma factor [Verrucomicrobiota bacterium]
MSRFPEPDPDFQQYAREGCPGAFRRLVERYAGAVHSAAGRVLGGRGHLAEDVAQGVFALLARKAVKLPETIEPGGWLHRQAVRQSLDALRREHRRAAREAASLDLHAMNTPDPNDGHDNAEHWAAVKPHLDQEIMKLGTADRQALMLRFFEERELAEIGARLGLSAGAVQKRIARALESLRVRLRRRGVAVSATALAALMSGEFVHAASSALTARLVSAASASAKAAAGSGALFSFLLLMKTKHAVLGTAVVLLLGGIAYHLAAPGTGTPSAGTPGKQTASSSPAIAANSGEDRLAAEARAIWEATVTFPGQAAYQKALREAVYEKDPDRKFALLHAMGVRLSRAAFDREIASRKGKWADPTKWQMLSRLTAEDMFIGFTEEWRKESPREALAWRFRLPMPNSIQWMEYILRDTTRSAAATGVDSAAWAAFMKVFPDPAMATHAAFWAKAEEGAGGFWEQALSAGVDPEFLNSMTRGKIQDDPPEDALRFLLRCPDPAERRRHLLLLSRRLSPERMLELSRNEFAQDAGAVTALRALAGDPGASFEEAAEVFRECKLRGFTEGLGSRWLERDPAAALRHAAGTRTLLLNSLMSEALQKGVVDEAFIGRSFADAPVEDRDKLYTALYQSMAGGDPAGALERIISSEKIGDQVTAARSVLEKWSFEHPADAAAWYRRLPATADRSELASTIVSGWIASEPEAALAFAKETGREISHQDLEVAAVAFGNAASLEETTAFLRQFRGREDYDFALARLAMDKFAGQPEAGIRYLKEEASGGGNRAALSMLSRMALFVTEPAEYARLALTLDLGGMEPDFVGNQAHLIIGDMVRYQQLKEAFDWTLQLPPAAGESARAWASGSSDLRKPENLSLYQDWVKAAPIREEERAKLLEAVRK